MTLSDTGPLIALINYDDPHHDSCRAALLRLPPSPLLTTVPCFTEAMYLLMRADGLGAQEKLWDFLEEGLVVIHESSFEERRRMRSLMIEHQDSPTDFADASLAALAETLNTRRIFTLDRHIHAYQVSDRHHFEVVP